MGRRLTTNEGKEIELNEQQDKAVDDILAWLKGQDLFLCLSGSAGTGKTTILKEALKDEYGVCATAPTHKAKRVISRVTGFNSETIQKLLGLRPAMQMEEFSFQKAIFQKLGVSAIEDWNVVAIDESSMINDELLKFIKNAARISKTKILFMGDINQLPPVNAKLSKIFTDEEIIQIRLSIVERQSGANPLIHLYDKILSDINSPYDLYDKVSNFNGEEGYKFITDRQDFINELAQKFKFGDYSDNKILSWTNAQVKRWNFLIRKNICNVTHPVQEGDYLLAYRTVNDLINWKINLIENACEYSVLSVIDSSKEGYRTFKCKIENLDNGHIRDVHILNPLDSKRFYAQHKELSDKAIKATEAKHRGHMWSNYYNFRDKIMLLGDITDERGVQLVPKDLDYYFAMTVHKSQGSTYENVFVDEPDINSNKKNAERNRLKYVALSRPSKSAIIYTK